MRVPFFLLCLTLLGAVLAFKVPGWQDLALVMVPLALGSLFLLIKAIIAASPEEEPEDWAEDQDDWQAPAPRQSAVAPPIASAPPRAEAASGAPWVLIDGSNVMHWNGGEPQLATVLEVMAALRLRGFRMGVVFDANAGYRLGGRHMDDAHMARLLGLPEQRVLVAPKGTPADPILLQTARDLRARIVSNDRYRDWQASHPELEVPGYLIRGYYREGRLALEL